MNINVTDLHRREHRFPAFDAAGLAGTSFKPEHFREIEADETIDGFFEIHAENYMGDGGMPHRLLEHLRQRFPVSLHGVCMSIGGEAALSRAHLQRFKALVDRYEPALVSEHLAWSTHDGVFYNDLLPLPYTDATLARVVDHVDEMQEAIGRPILLENPATYLVFEQSTFAEQDFLGEIVRRTGCGLLLDVNNVFVSATNHGTDAWTYLSRFPLHHVGEIHLAGHGEDADADGRLLLIDSHNGPVADPVWALYERVIARTGPVATLVEWDAEIPAWSILKSEAQAARAILARHAPRHMLGHRHG